MKTLRHALCAIALSVIAGTSQAATLSLAGSGYDLVNLTNKYDLDGNATYNALDPNAVARDGSKVSVLTGANKTSSNGLSVSGPAKVTFTYLGSEAGFTNISLLLPETELFRNHGGSALGAVETTTVASGGLLPFLFKTLIGLQGEISNNGSATPNMNTIAIAYSALFNGGKSVIVLFDDTGAGPDRDYDDLAMRIDVAPIPLPAAGLLLVGALGGLAAVRRRKA